MKKETHTSSSISFMPSSKILIWATDTNGFVLTSIIERSSPEQIRWSHVSSSERFACVSVGAGLQVWAVDTEGRVHFRMGIHARNLRGTSWSKIKFKETSELVEEERFKLISVGRDCVWAVSVNDDLYFRENISKVFPEGTAW